MVRSTITAAALLAASVITAGAADIPVKAPPIRPADPPPFFIVNDNSISYHYEFKATDPGQGFTPKHVATFTHFDVWAYGTNFFTIDWLKATSTDTAAGPCPVVIATGCQPYTEIYGLFRSTLGWNQLSGTRNFAFGPLKNISFLVGSDINTDNTFFASAKRTIEGGLQFDFSMPYNGFFNVGVVAYKEWQHNGYQSAFNPANPSGSLDFDVTWRVEMLYVQPLGFLPANLPFTYTFLGGIQGPKGNGVAGQPDRVTEYRLQQTLAYDIGKFVVNRPNMYSVWVGHRYWKNKFGLDPATIGFTKENQWLAGTTWAF